MQHETSEKEINILTTGSAVLVAVIIVSTLIALKSLLNVIAYERVEREHHAQAYAQEKVRVASAKTHWSKLIDEGARMTTFKAVPPNNFNRAYR